MVALMVLCAAIGYLIAGPMGAAVGVLVAVFVLPEIFR